MGKCVCRSRVSQVIGRHVNSLYGCDGTVLCRCNTLLESAHLRLQGRLVSNRGWHTAKQSGNLGTCLCETEDVVDEQKDVLSCLVTEILCHGQSGQSDSHTGSRRLVHLSEHHGRLIDNA